MASQRSDLSVLFECQSKRDDKGCSSKLFWGIDQGCASFYDLSMLSPARLKAYLDHKMKRNLDQCPKKAYLNNLSSSRLD